MRILAVGDTHNHKELKEKIIKEANSGKYELFIGLGDYTKKDYFLDLLKRIKIQKLCLTGNWDFDFKVPGNNEVPNLFNYVKVNYKARDGDYKIVMLGAAFPTNFKKEIVDWVGDFNREKVIICSHYPPHLIKDLTNLGTHGGLPEFRDLIIRLKPTLWLCGHIHESFGFKKFLKTTVVNASACDVDYKPSRLGVSIEVEEKGLKEVKELKLK